jgi:hypothetical protein
MCRNIKKSRCAEIYTMLAGIGLSAPDGRSFKQTTKSSRSPDWATFAEYLIREVKGPRLIAVSSTWSGCDLLPLLRSEATEQAYSEALTAFWLTID